MHAVAGSASCRGPRGAADARRLGDATPLVPRMALQWMEQGGVVAKLFASLDGRITEDNGYILWKRLDAGGAVVPGGGGGVCCACRLCGGGSGGPVGGQSPPPAPPAPHAPRPRPPRYLRIQVPPAADDGSIPTVWYLSQAQVEEDIVGVRYGYYLLPSDVDIAIDVGASSPPGRGGV